MLLKIGVVGDLATVHDPESQFPDWDWSAKILDVRRETATTLPLLPTLVHITMQSRDIYRASSRSSTILPRLYAASYASTADALYHFLHMGPGAAPNTSPW